MCGLSFTIILSHLALCSTGPHAHGSALLTQCLDLTRKNKNERWTYPPGRTPGSERIHWQGGGILSPPNSFATTCWKCRHLPLSPTTSWPLQASLSSTLKSPQWPHGFWLGQGPLWHQKGSSPGWSSVSRCQGRPAHQEPFPLGSPCGSSNLSCNFPWLLPVSMP